MIRIYATLGIGMLKHQPVIAQMIICHTWLKTRFQLAFEFRVPRLVRLTRKNSFQT
jgi:hypothetical protein